MLPEQTAIDDTPLISAAPPTEAGFTVTFTDLDTEQLPFDIITVYVPVRAVVALLITGFCEVDVYPLGPDQLQLVPPVAVRFRLLPEHIGLLLPTVVLLTVRAATTVTVLVTRVVPQPVTSYRIVAVPADTPVTSPLLFTVAILVALLLHTPFGVASENCVVDPIQAN